MKHIFLAERFGEQEYTVNGVRYIVGSCFQSSNSGLDFLFLRLHLGFLLSGSRTHIFRCHCIIRTYDMQRYGVTGYDPFEAVMDGSTCRHFAALKTGTDNIANAVDRVFLLTQLLYKIISFHNVPPYRS